MILFKKYLSVIIISIFSISNSAFAENITATNTLDVFLSSTTLQQADTLLDKVKNQTKVVTGTFDSKKINLFHVLFLLYVELTNPLVSK